MNDFQKTMEKFFFPNKTFEEEMEEKKTLHKCPKSDRCVMDCPHKIPHSFDKFCDPESDVNKIQRDKCPKCVKEIAADITFFEEDFEIK